MAKFDITFKRSIRKDLRNIPAKDTQRILARIDALADNPWPPEGQKIAEQPYYRVRQGDYRILYQVEEEERVVIVVKVAHRRHVYRSR